MFSDVNDLAGWYIHKNKLHAVCVFNENFKCSSNTLFYCNWLTSTYRMCINLIKLCCCLLGTIKAGHVL